MVHLSGSTCCTLMFNGNKVYSSNAGDSWAILIKINEDGLIDIEELTTDHKPSNPLESKWILKCKGVIDTFKDDDGSDLGPMWVWAPNNDMPGLAMSRSIGDGLAH
jgi:serine/threonine protein phosphatase PrpC